MLVIKIRNLVVQAAVQAADIPFKMLNRAALEERIGQAEPSQVAASADADHLPPWLVTTRFVIEPKASGPVGIHRRALTRDVCY